MKKQEEQKEEMVLVPGLGLLPKSQVQPAAGPDPDEDLVLTPDGYRPRGQVHHVEPGHLLTMERDNICKVERATGKKVADYGPIPVKASKEPLMPGNVFVPAAK